MFVCMYSMCVPPHSCCRLSSASSAVGGRSGRSSTISSAPGCLGSPLSYTGERENRPLYPRLPQLQIRHTKHHWSDNTMTQRVVCLYHVSPIASSYCKPHICSALFSCVWLHNSLDGAKICTPTPLNPRLPLGKTPGSMNVAMQKLARVKRKIIAM